MGKLAYYLLTNLTALSNETTGIVDSAIFMEMVLLEPSELSLSSDDGLFWMSVWRQQFDNFDSHVSFCQ